MVPCNIRTYAATLKTTIHPKTWCRKPYAATQHLMLLMGVAHTTYATALKTTTHPKTRCRKPYAATQHLMLLMMGVAQHHPHRTHDLRSGSQDHHPSKNWMQKTVCCNSTYNAPDYGRMYPKHVELRIHQKNYLVASSWHFKLFHE
jgi:hypothetical protein